MSLLWRKMTPIPGPAYRICRVFFVYPYAFYTTLDPASTEDSNLPGDTRQAVPDKAGDGEADDTEVTEADEEGRGV